MANVNAGLDDVELPILSTILKWTASCLLLTLCVAPVCAAESSRAEVTSERTNPATLSDRFVTAYSRLVRLDSEAESQQKVTERLESAAKKGLSLPGVLQSLMAADENLQEAMTKVLQQSDNELIEALTQLTLELEQQEGKIHKEWTNVRTEVIRRKLRLFEVQASQQLAGQLAILMSVENRWLWLFGLLAIGSLAVVTLHDRRHEFRRWLNGGKARSLGLAQVFAVLLVAISIITGGIFAFGDRIFDTLNTASVGQDQNVHLNLEQEVQGVEADLDVARHKAAEVEAQFKKAIRETRVSLGPASLPSKLLDDWERITVRTQEANVELQVLGKLGTKLRDDIEALKQLKASVANTAESTASSRNFHQSICVLLGFALLGLATSGGVLLQRGMRRRRDRVSNTCPLCLGESTFVALNDEPNGFYAGLQMVECKNVISEQPYEQCEFTFTAMYRDVTKLCFPTLGIPQAGKTHWLAMVYRELNRGNYPKSVQFERIKSSSSDNFDVVVDEILNRKIGPAATQTGRVPHPLVFNFLDRDRLGVSDILVNIFDYSGEVIRSQTLEDRQRRRALDGDGFFFFLDPTEPSETQSEALAGFREDLRRIKGVKAGRQIRTPVALCVSKIDLMINEPYADPNGGGVIANFYQDLGKVGWNLDQASIRARSQLVARLRDTIWPGWQIERQIHELFGGRYMFFPLTPVGLDGVGEADLARRTIAPVGLLDPLVWLLHMNGYPVLK